MIQGKNNSEDTFSVTLAGQICEALDDGKAVDISTLDVRELTIITDFMVIASGRSNRQVKALLKRVVGAARAVGAEILGIEGERQGEWVLIDLGDVVIHIMQPQVREFYQLEKLWGVWAPAKLSQGISGQA
ncbi:MAG: ribosome silencing factor [Gammaproteobacteria bacterium]|nr:ribosome silencing factor [Gammaproteobacteria bacterium]